jgi:uncharacterized protein DUF4019
MIRMAAQLWQELNRDLRMRRESRTFFVRALSLFIVLGLAGCNASVRRSGIPAGAQAALQTAIDDIDAGRYDKLYQEASDEWRRQSSSEESNATLQKMQDKLGRARTRTQQTAREEQTSTAPVAGHSVIVIYQTTFDRGEGIETFTLIEHGGRWALAKYYVSSSGAR